ncbi:hypothetical protein CcaCcLH18_12436 [Colletotrichum camelliae]|nr:hypothetical protein CcaCcLH18_12436 [Colletotrichum camelliae]
MSALPKSEGYLSYFLVYQGLSALAHSTVCYLKDPNVSMVSFSGHARPPPTKLQAHLYGIKNVYTGLIRLYAAYNISNPQLYDLAAWTSAGVLFLYLTEFSIWNTVRARELTFPLVTASANLIWMLWARGYYLQ